jgi:hypothetical protein
MSGFSTSRSGTDSRSKQYGSILRGHGPPVPQAGVPGDLYIDVLTFQLFEKREIDGLDAWGHYLFVVPSLYQSNLRWFGPSAPSNILGLAGDYFLQWGGYDNYGMMPTIWGPKLWTGWPENGEGVTNDPGTAITVDGVLQLGLVAEGLFLTDMMLNQLIAIGVSDEYIIPLSVTANINEPVLQVGLQSTGQLVLTLINPLYTAEDEHAL